MGTENSAWNIIITIKVFAFMVVLVTSNNIEN